MAKSILITLKDRTILNLSKPGRYTFGHGYNGLYLIASELAGGGLSKVWNQKIHIRGAGNNGKARPRELGLGKYPGVSVADVTEEAEANAKLAKQGIDPLEPTDNVSVPNFKTVALEIVKENVEVTKKQPKPRWGTKTLTNMTENLNLHCFPFIGETSVDQIGRHELEFLIALHPESPSGASKLIHFMKQVFNRCVYKDYIVASPLDNAFMSQMPRSRGPDKPYAALLEKNLPAAFAGIDKKDNHDIALRALLKTIMLNAVRPHSAENARWDEIQWKEIECVDDWNEEGWEPVEWDNLDSSTKAIIWKVPDAHMKMGKSFNIPVSHQFLEILKTMRSIRGEGKRDPKLIFASPRGGTFARLSSRRLLHSLNFDSDTPGKKPMLHGFRSTARTWAEKRKVPNRIAEATLAHNAGDKLVVTYMRWDLLEPRSRLQQFYADYATGILTEGWIWIEPEIQAQINAERERADRAESRADESERELKLVRAELTEVRTELKDISKLLKALLEQKSAA